MKKQKLRLYEHKGRFYEFGSEESNEMISKYPKDQVLILKHHSEDSKDPEYLEYLNQKP